MGYPIHHLFPLIPLSLIFGVAACDYDTGVTPDETLEGGELEEPLEDDEVGLTREYDTSAWDWDEYDINRDDRIDRTEWDERLGATYGEWDVDGDGQLTDEELQRGVYSWWDANDDDVLERDELDPSLVGSLGLDEQYHDFAAWDADDDMRVTEQEFGDVWTEADPWGGWDTDASGRLSEQELSQGWFDAWDVNRDTYIDRTEWGWDLSPSS